MQAPDSPAIETSSSIPPIHSSIIQLLFPLPRVKGCGGNRAWTEQSRRGPFPRNIPLASPKGIPNVSQASRGKYSTVACSHNSAKPLRRWQDKSPAASCFEDKSGGGGGRGFLHYYAEHISITQDITNVYPTHKRHKEQQCLYHPLYVKCGTPLEMTDLMSHHHKRWSPLKVVDIFALQCSLTSKTTGSSIKYINTYAEFSTRILLRVWLGQREIRKPLGSST